MSIAIVTVYIFCWFPYSLIFLILQPQDTFTHFSFAIYMTDAYCAINPVICFMFSSNYRKALKRLKKCSFVRA
ncbi:unnamed protein product [Porites evermanni]|uniref:G-protein coupled receptors family 1 profile domain-containing protein n=1 Tax=Porites evermanni TaxID=104178 RepID=A0ABN8SBF8_9CNID|nr:unnamed protein product [Porites evermanni]